MQWPVRECNPQPSHFAVLSTEMNRGRAVLIEGPGSPDCYGLFLPEGCAGAGLERLPLSLSPFVHPSLRDVIAGTVGCSGLMMEELAAWPGVALGGLEPADTRHLGFQGAKLSPLTHG